MYSIADVDTCVSIASDANEKWRSFLGVGQTSELSEPRRVWKDRLCREMYTWMAQIHMVPAVIVKDWNSLPLANGMTFVLGIGDPSDSGLVLWLKCELRPACLCITEDDVQSAISIARVCCF